jgi:S-DNA-T family DNA segregation ATPase FtsK/SpoIIIE
MTTTNWTPEQTNNMLALVQKLNGLGINAKPSGIENGPVVTAYLFDLDHSESITRILKRAEDFALSLGVDKVIIQRVKDKIAVFIPNEKRSTIDYKDILYWYMKDPEVQKAYLPIALGVDFHGEKSFLDLADMPHILLTGSTGSGKSVFEASILSNFFYRFSPNDLNCYLVDTKRLDLPLFKGMPHVHTVAEDIEQFHAMMYHIMPEIRRRNGVLQTAGVRKIQEYHKMMGGTAGMPYILVMIDELGDLMDIDNIERKADKEKYETTPTVKQWIKQAVQIGRAAGVHIIACTQRASVKVVDGDIKANLPCRISLRLPTQVDSRTILGVSGAENLLGKGDMLVQRPEKDVLERYHGPFVSMEDIQQLVVNYEQIRSMFV